MAKIWLQKEQEVKKQAAERRTLQGLNLIKKHSKKEIQITEGM